MEMHGKNPLSHPADSDLRGLIDELAALDQPTDESSEWPELLWGSLSSHRVPLWSIPREVGGEGLDRPTLVRRNAIIASASLTAAFILTQHDAAARRLAAAASLRHEAASHWLSKIVRGEAYCTVGLSQLTTSRRLGTRALVAQRRDSGGFVVSGAMPWVTAAARADVLVGGAVLEDDLQILFLVPTSRAGIEIASPMHLAALQASCTTEVICRDVQLDAEEVLVGPIPDALSLAAVGGGTGGLETSALAVGQALAALDALRRLAIDRQELKEASAALDATWSEVAADLMASARDPTKGPQSAEVRRRANDLVLRSTQAYLAARKGSGFLRSDPAQRWAQQALFFLVWSCPSPVVRAAIDEFAGICPID
jgi:butyryl-CoA dehydrogenase